MVRSVLVIVAAASAGLVAAAGASERTRRAGESVRVEHPRSTMAYVPGGSFTRGPTPLQMDEMIDMCREQLGDSEWCAPQRLGFTALAPEQVHVDAFWIDRFEVTAGEYRACVSDGSCGVAALVAGDERYLEDEWPMVNVSWHDAVDYCTWAGKRLPTEAEWEKAARGEDGRMWPWGNHVRADGSNHGAGDYYVELVWTKALHPGQLHFPSFRGDDADGFSLVAPPGSLPWGESPYGAHDMAGNVSEWVQDYYAPTYEDLSQVNPVRATPAGERVRVVRGGAWDRPLLYGITWLREPQLDPVRQGKPGVLPDHRSPSRGFRCARDS